MNIQAEGRMQSRPKHISKTKLKIKKMKVTDLLKSLFGTEKENIINNSKTDTTMAKKLHLETLALHVGQENADPATDSRAVPIYQTASYVFHNAKHAADRFGLRDAGNIYGRLTNSTQGVFEDRVAALEGGVAGLAVASGAAAVTYALQNIAQNGDHIVAADNLYGGSYNLITHTLSTQGVDYTIVNVNDLKALEAAIRPNTKAVYVETFGNPNSDITNLDAIAEIAHKHNTLLIVDNTFGTPVLIRPIEHGADVVVHSATKFLGGHGSSLGGVIVDAGKFDFKANADKYPTLAKPDPSYHGAVFADVAGAAAFVTRIRAVILRDTGATISPFNAWILLQGVESLPLRIERHVENALKVVDFLSKHPRVCHTLHFLHTETTSSTRSSSLREPAASSHSRLTALRTMHGSLSTISRYSLSSLTWQT